MPINYDKSSGKWKIGGREPVYDTKESAERAYKGYLASKNAIKKKNRK